MKFLLQEQQAQFMQVCGQKLFSLKDWISPQPKDKKHEMIQQAYLYKRLMQEELMGEFISHFNESFEVGKFENPLSPEQLTDFLDDCLDVIYVTLGFMNTLGLPGKEGWDEVQRSNMAKAGPDGKVLRREDGKILKPDGWTPPNLLSIIASELDPNPWQAKASAALVKLNKLTRETQQLAGAFRDRDFIALHKAGKALSDANMEYLNAINEGLIKNGIKSVSESN